MENSKEKLNVDEVIALHRLGLPTSKIVRMRYRDFEALLNKNPEMEESLDRINELLDKQEEMGIVSISCQDSDFPASLLKIGEDCPVAIHCKGNLELLKHEDAVAIIGARAADRQGNSKAYELGRDFAKKGKVIMSGLALGCDAAAHRGCLDAGGKTIAIVGNGLDICHPKENKQLEQMILQKGGLMLSEQLIGVKANPSRLVARNRLQAALSQTVILAQCPAQSGSLHTMRFARKYGKECLAAVFTSRNEANAGNYLLIDSGLAKPIGG